LCWLSAALLDTALRLSKVFGTSMQFWMGLQDEYELREARNAIEDQLEHIMPFAS
jgi:plasmid maintenance system antidote protein VapI